MILITLVMMELLGGIEVTVFVPSFTQLITEFHLSPFAIELTVVVNMLAMCIAVLVVGNLSDIYGRKRILLISVIIFIIGSIICVISRNFPELLIGRFIQGIGIAAPGLIPYTIISDLYSEKEQRTVFGIVNGSLTLIIAASPVIGSYIAANFHWRYNFILLLALACLALILGLLCLPTSKRDFISGAGKLDIFKGYIAVIKSEHIMNYVFALAFLVTPYWVFTAIAPILYVKDLGLSIVDFGFHQALLVLLFSFLSFFNGRFVNGYGPKNCLAFSMTLLMISIVCIVLYIGFGMNNAFAITAIMGLLAIAEVFPFNILYQKALNMQNNIKGKVTATIISVRQIIIAVSIQSTSYFYNDSFVPLGVVMVILLCLMFYFYKRLHIHVLS